MRCCSAGSIPPVSNGLSASFKIRNSTYVFQRMRLSSSRFRPYDASAPANARFAATLFDAGASSTRVRTSPRICQSFIAGYVHDWSRRDTFVTRARGRSIDCERIARASRSLRTPVSTLLSEPGSKATGSSDRTRAVVLFS
jgi:hypothetical protein